MTPSYVVRYSKNFNGYKTTVTAPNDAAARRKVLARKRPNDTAFFIVDVKRT
jgi:hypothetical protein